MSEIKFIGGPMRLQSYSKLKVFLANPGKFCLIVLGDRGSGKHFAIENAFENIALDAPKELCLTNFKFIEPNDVPDNEGDLDRLFKSNEYKTIVIEDVEELSHVQQRLLFKALSTKDGTFGLENKFNLRIVFTSSKDAEVLRTPDPLIGFFWDRISQLVVEFPSFKSEGSNVIKDFYSTWDKMTFENTIGYKHLSGKPKNPKLEKFLDDNVMKFEGGFRDLDKIACLYFNYRIFHYGTGKKILEDIEKMIVDNVRDDFFTKSQMHGSSSNDYNVFVFEEGFDHKELLGRYKMQLRKWASKKYHTIANAEKVLGFMPGSMKNYVETKVTTKHKEHVAKQKKK